MISTPLRVTRVPAAIAILFALAAAGNPNVKPGVVVKIAPNQRTSADDKSSNWMRVGQLATGGSMAKGGEIEIYSYSWGAANSGGSAAGDPDRPLVTGRVPDATRENSEMSGGQTQASKQNKLQELRARSVADINKDPTPAGGAARFNPKEISVTKTVPWQAVPQPLDRGAVRVKVKFPWVGCHVGARYPSLELGASGKTYVLSDVTVASCGGSGDADDRPTEEVAFYYNRIAFKYSNTR